MDDISNKSEERKSILANETATHIRNLILNECITITTAPAAQPQPQNFKRSNENPQQRGYLARQDVLSYSAVPTPLKRRILSVDAKDIAVPLNPLSSLPLSLISNGTLSVTSDSSCVAIENGIPILKEISGPNKDKEASASIVRDTQSSRNVSITTPYQKAEAAQFKKIANNSLELHESKKNIHVTAESTDINEPKGIAPGIADNANVRQLLLKALADVAKVSPFGKLSLIPNPNQIDFLTLLGLEIVVDSCCPSDAREKTETLVTPKPLRCDQCHIDFTIKWHFYKSPLKVLCDRCYAFNEQQILKAARTIRLSKEYARIFQLKHKSQNTLQTKPCEGKLSRPSSAVPTQYQQQQLYQRYVNAAGIGEKDMQVNDLTKLGASIAMNPEIFETSKIVNSLNSTAAPLSRAQAIQNFQIALFKGLQQKFNPLNLMEIKTHINSNYLINYQLKIAQMVEKANLATLKSENPNFDAPLTAILRAIETQHQSLINTIRKHVPKSSV